jgi:hypothetical protein
LWKVEKGGVLEVVCFPAAFFLFNNYLVLAQGKLGLLYELAPSIAAIFSEMTITSCLWA